MDVSKEDFNRLILALCSLCDSQKRLERAIRYDGEDRESLLSEAKKRRETAERTIERIRGS